MPRQRASSEPNRIPVSRSSLPNALSQALEQGVAITGDISFDLSDIRRPTIKTNLLVHLASKPREVGFDTGAERRRLRELEEANRHLAERLARLEAERRAAERRARIAARLGPARAERPPHVSRYDILVAIAAQPQGVTLAQLAEELAVPADDLSAPIEELLTMGEIVQHDSAYQMPRRERPPVVERPVEAAPEEAARVSEPVVKLVEEVLADVEALLTSRLAGKPAVETEPEEVEIEIEGVAIEPEARPAAEAEEAAVEPEAEPVAEAEEIEEAEIEFEPEEMEIEVEGAVVEPPVVEEAVPPVEEPPPPAKAEPRRLPPAETKELILAALRDQQVGLTLPELGIALKRPWQGLIPLVKALMNEELVEKHNKWYYPAIPIPEDDLLAAIASQPGLTLPQLGEVLGVRWQGLTRRVRQLVDNRFVERRGREYYSRI